MSYLLPKRALQQKEPLEYKDLNEDFIPCAERASGKFNEHNFTTNLKGNADLSEQVYYRHYYKNVSADPQFGASGTFNVPVLWTDPSFSPNAWQIPNSYEWEVVGGTDPMTFTITTGNSVLWGIAWLQYIWLGFDTTGNHDYSQGTNPCRVQFAIRVDGAIIEETIPGQKDTMARSWMPVMAIPQRSDDDLRPGPQVPKDLEDNTSIGPEMRPDRPGFVIPLTQGEHTIELVARRVRPADYSGFIYESNDRVYVYSRRLFLLEIHAEPQSASVFTSVEVDAFEPEDVYSQASVQTDRLNVIRDAENAVTAGMAARGSLNRAHLESPVLDMDQTTIQPASFQVTDDYYPGYTSNTMAPAKMGSDGWWLLDNGAAGYLQTLASHPATWDVTSQKSLVLVLANVQGRKVVDPAVGDTTRLDAFAAIGLGLKYVGAVPWVQDESIGFINHYNWNDEDEIDIPLFFVYDFATGIAPADIEYFGVYASTMIQSWGPAPHVGHRSNFSWQLGSLQVVQLRY